MSALHTLVEAAERATEGDGPKPAHAPAPALTEEERKQKIKSLPRVARTPLPAALGLPPDELRGPLLRARRCSASVEVTPPAAE